MDMSELCAYACCTMVSRWGSGMMHTREEAYHGLDIRMRNRVKLVVLELELGAEVDICALVLRRVAISGCREDWVEGQQQAAE